MVDVGDVVTEPPRAADVRERERRAGGRLSRPYEWFALAAAVLPIVVAVTRALLTPWRPTYDAAYYPARALDVFTSHHPLVGAWSTLSYLSHDSFINLGPLQLQLL